MKGRGFLDRKKRIPAALPEIDLGGQ